MMNKKIRKMVTVGFLGLTMLFGSFNTVQAKTNSKEVMKQVKEYMGDGYTVLTEAGFNTRYVFVGGYAQGETNTVRVYFTYDDGKTVMQYTILVDVEL